MQQNNPLANVEFADNPEPRCPVALIVDKSGSMQRPPNQAVANGVQPIQAVNDALQQFRAELARDTLAMLRAEIALVAFNHRVVHYDFTSVQAFAPPVLGADGGTKISLAVNTALDLLDTRKQVYRENGISYFRPIALLLTDGRPEHDTPEELEKTRERLMIEEEDRRIAFFSFGVEGADINALSQVMPPNRPPRHIGSATQIAGLFQWLSNSVAKISTSNPGDRIRLDQVDDYLDY